MVRNAYLEQAIGSRHRDWIIDVINTFFLTPLKICTGSHYSHPTCFPKKITHSFIIFDATIAHYICLRGLLRSVSLDVSMPCITA